MLGTSETENLRLVPHAPEHLRALIHGPEFYEAASGMTPATGLRNFIVSPDVSSEWLVALENASEPDPWRYGFAVFHVASKMVIGSAGFAGPPDAEGSVEIAYGIVPTYQRRGYGTEAAHGLITHAQADPRVRLLCAHTLPETNPSTRILKKCGFRRVAEFEHPTDGLVWRWERTTQLA